MNTIEVDATSKQKSRMFSSGWALRPSHLAKSSVNQIREVVERLKIEPNPEKPLIPLSIGDPTVFGNLNASAEIIDAVRKSLECGKYNGYAHSSGHESARKAVAQYVSHQGVVDHNDIILCSGCSSALDICILTIAGRGDNILVPRPGFSLYSTLCKGIGIEIRHYDLLPDKEWEADLPQMESLIDVNTRCILVNNPSNPCGSVYSETHLTAIIKIAEAHYLPIIADEIYEHFVFPGVKHIAISSLSQNVPVLSCGGLTKRFLVPGWRMGWIVIHDRQNRLKDVIAGLKNMGCRILGSNSLIQGALPDILSNTPKSFFDNVLEVLSKNADVAFNILNKVPGLKPVLPKGAMYMMIGIEFECFPYFSSDIQFVETLVKEQSVFCLPGSCFEYPKYIRIVLTTSAEMITEACMRIADFCAKYFETKNNFVGGVLLQADSY